MLNYSEAAIDPKRTLDELGLRVYPTASDKLKLPMQLPIYLANNDELWTIVR